MPDRAIYNFGTDEYISANAEGIFDQAEPHLLAAGKRDSARLLAQMMIEWWQATSTSSSPGPFVLRGTLS